MTTVTEKTWAERVKDMRDNFGMTQAEFAERLGLQDRSSICQLEKGWREPKGPLRVLLVELEKTL